MPTLGCSLMPPIFQLQLVMTSPITGSSAPTPFKVKWVKPFFSTKPFSQQCSKSTRDSDPLERSWPSGQEVSSCFLWILGVHFPHHQNDMDDYTEATREIHSFAANVQGTPFLIAGDWNSQHNGPNVDQQALEIACLAAEAVLHIAMPAAPTWKHNKTYDFFLCSQRLHSKLSPATTPFPTYVTSFHLITTWWLGTWSGKRNISASALPTSTLPVDYQFRSFGSCHPIHRPHPACLG